MKGISETVKGLEWAEKVEISAAFACDDDDCAVTQWLIRSNNCYTVRLMPRLKEWEKLSAGK